jgi:hypothetical protein
MSDFTGSAAAQAVRRRSLTAEARVRNVRFVVNKVALEQVFPDCLGFDHSTNAPYASSYKCSSYQKGKRVKPGDLPKSNALSENGGHWIEKDLHFIFQISVG